jgi:hypothetical protein
MVNARIGQPPPPLLLALWVFPYLTVGCQPGKKLCALGPALAEARAGRCAMGDAPSSMPWAERHCASRPPRTVLMGRTELGPLAIICFPKFSELDRIIANFKNLYKIHLTSKNYKTNFVG